MAREAFYSQFHFTRKFLELKGETPGSYLRRRRLEEAANEILDGTDILQVALDYHFGSQEAFTRSFKAHFQITPGFYRKKGNNIMKGRKTAMEKEPEIRELPEFRLVGFPYYGVPDRIPEIWGKFLKMYKSIYGKQLTGKTYAFIFNCQRELSYMPSLEVTTLDRDIPLEFTGKIVPAATWAMFEANGEDIDETMAYAHSEWFPKSGYEYSLPHCEMEIRPEGYPYDPPGNTDAVFYYCYPVKKRAA